MHGRAALVVGLLSLSVAAAAQDAETPRVDAVRTPPITLRTTIKSSLLAADNPAGDSGVSLWRLRLEPTARLGNDIIVQGAYEQRLRLDSNATMPGSGILPTTAGAPYRVRQLDWPLTQQGGLIWRHEVDRAFLAWTLPRETTLTVGRQAVGWGRGVVFGAVDLFSPFTALEADREWRRGVDAIRLEVPLSNRASVDGVAAVGRNTSESIVAGRLRGYAGNTDLEVVGGRRARDLFGGVTTSRAVRGLEVHGEAVLFRVPDEDAPDERRTIAKVVAGGSYRFPAGSGVLTFVEYCYSGFGVSKPQDIRARLAVPAFAARVARGDVQTLGRHALATTLSSEPSAEWAVSGLWLHSLTDGSGVVAPSVTYSVGDATSVVTSVYRPYGAGPSGTTLRSEFGAQGLTVFIQLRIYL